MIATEPDTALGRIAVGHEHLKALVAEARRMYTLALNAMFDARRARGEVEAYAAVTGELRRFSRQLDAEADELRSLITRLVYVGADRQRHRRRLERLGEAVATAYGPGAHIGAERLAQEQAVLERRESEMKAAEKELDKRLAHLGRLADAGRVLAVLARTESARVVASDSGGGSGATEVEGVLDGIDKHIEGMGLCVADAGRAIS